MVCRNRKLDTSHLGASTVGNKKVWMTPRSQLPLVFLLLLNCLVEHIPSFELTCGTNSLAWRGLFSATATAKSCHLRIQSQYFPFLRAISTWSRNCPLCGIRGILNVCILLGIIKEQAFQFSIFYFRCRHFISSLEFVPLWRNLIEVRFVQHIGHPYSYLEYKCGMLHRR